MLRHHRWFLNVSRHLALLYQVTRCWVRSTMYRVRSLVLVVKSSRHNVPPPHKDFRLKEDMGRNEAVAYHNHPRLAEFRSGPLWLCLPASCRSLSLSPSPQLGLSADHVRRTRIRPTLERATDGGDWPDRQNPHSCRRIRHSPTPCRSTIGQVALGNHRYLPFPFALLPPLCPIQPRQPRHFPPRARITRHSLLVT